MIKMASSNMFRPLKASRLLSSTSFSSSLLKSPMHTFSCSCILKECAAPIRSAKSRTPASLYSTSSRLASPTSSGPAQGAAAPSASSHGHHEEAGPEYYQGFLFYTLFKYQILYDHNETEWVFRSDYPGHVQEILLHRRLHLLVCPAAFLLYSPR